MGPEEVLGSVGTCTYGLDRLEDGWRGTRVCTGLPRQPAWLRPPQVLLEEPSPMAVSARVLLGA